MGRPGRQRRAYADLMLMRDTGSSARHLAVRFRDEVGVPPKLFAQLLWFRRAVRLLDAGDPGDLAWVAVAAGYADFARAAASPGAEVVRAVADTDYGSRDHIVRDPEGNLWCVGTYRPALSADASAA